MEAVESRPIAARTANHRELILSRSAEEEEEEDEGMEDYGEESGDEDEEGGDEEGGEESEEEGGEEDYGAEDPEEFNPKVKIPHVGLEDKYFLHGEKLRSKFNEVELDSFMRLLNLKPFKQW